MTAAPVFGQLRLAIVAAVAAISCVSSACSRPAGEAGPPPASATPDTGVAPVRIDAIEAQRLGPDTLRVTLRLVHDGASPQPVPFDDLFTSAPRDAGSIADVYLSDPEGSRKYYVLRDANDRPQCSTDQTPIDPGERREVWAIFPAPPEGTDRIRVHVPRGELFTGVPFTEVPINQPGRATGSR